MKDNTAEKSLVWLPVLVGGTLFVLLNIWGLVLNGGVFTYPLDDTYIHLSMAEQILRGEYGINPGEFAAADSSIIYPFLLLPFAGTALHQYMPLFWNSFALVWSLILIEKIFRESGFYRVRNTRLMAIIAMVVAPVSLNIIGIALLGMEQMLHILMVLFALLGLIRWQANQRLNFYLVVAILLAPMIRYEATGIALLLAFMVAWDGRRLAGVALGLLAVLPVAGFSIFLYLADGNFLPNSVLRKLNVAREVDHLPFLINFSTPSSTFIAWLFLGVAGVISWVLLSGRVQENGLSKRVGLIAIAALVGHVLFGRIGWGNRYEAYIIIFGVLAFWVVFIPILQQQTAMSKLARGIALAILVLPITHFLLQTVERGPFSMNSIYAQQAQMGHFARDYVMAPVLVNDIGLPSFQNEHNVVDIWGLASTRALKAWAYEAPRGWVNELANDTGADLAMVYENWVRPAAAPGWTTLGYLTLKGPSYAVAGRQVTFFATNPQSVERLQKLMREFAPILPDAVVLEVLDPPEPYIPQTEG